MRKKALEKEIVELRRKNSALQERLQAKGDLKSVLIEVGHLEVGGGWCFVPSLGIDVAILRTDPIGTFRVREHMESE